MLDNLIDDYYFFFQRWWTSADDIKVKMPKARLNSRSATSNQKTEPIQDSSDKSVARQNKMKSDVVTKNTREKVYNVRKKIQSSRKDTSALQKKG